MTETSPCWKTAAASICSCSTHAARDSLSAIQPSPVLALALNSFLAPVVVTVLKATVSAEGYEPRESIVDAVDEMRLEMVGVR